MERHVLGFLRASLLWLVGGTALGLVMATVPSWIAYRPVHVHALLLGFVTMFIAGVAYHVVPRFAAAALHSGRLADAHLVIANVGLLLLEGGFIARVHATQFAPLLLGLGGGLSAIGAWMLAWNLWRTLGRAVLPPTRLPRVRPMPVMSPPHQA